MPIAAATIGAGATLGAAGIGALGSLAGGFLGNISANKQFKEAGQLSEAQKAGAFQYLQQHRGQDAFYAALQEAQIKAANRQSLRGFKGARRALDLGAVRARDAVRTQGAQNLADLEQSAVSRGLLGTSTGAQAFAGIGNQTSQQLAAIDTQLAQSFADLGLARAATKSQGTLRLAGLAGETRAREEGLLYELAQLAPQQGFSFSSGKGNFFKKIF